jgi:hypothetical protein
MSRDLFGISGECWAETRPVACYEVAADLGCVALVGARRASGVRKMDGWKRSWLQLKLQQNSFLATA